MSSSNGERRTPASYGLVEGFEFPARRFAIGRDFQVAKLECCGIAPALYGDRLDITLLGFPVLEAMLESGLELTGMVHMFQRFRQSRPLGLDTPLSQTGRITRIEPHAKGHVIRSAFDFEAEDGGRPLSIERASLLPGPAPDGAPGGAADRPADTIESVTALSSTRLIPELVARYTDEAGNLIHSDPEVARQYGFRAPIAAGLMGVQLLLAALVDGAPPEALDISIWFKRPMFWDDRLTVLAKRQGGQITDLRLQNDEGKATSLARIDAITRPRA